MGNQASIEAASACRLLTKTRRLETVPAWPERRR
jgi:hypothetical protein